MKPGSKPHIRFGHRGGKEKKSNRCPHVSTRAINVVSRKDYMAENIINVD